MTINYDPGLNAEIRRVVHNFNQKRNRAIKRGYSYIPPLLTVRELKSRYEKRSDLLTELKQIEKFNLDKDEALRVVETSGGAKTIKWDLQHLKSNINKAKQFYDREIERAKYLEGPNSVLRKSYLDTLRTKRAYLDLELSELTPSQLQTYRATINEYLYDNDRKARGYRNWMNEIEMIMRVLGYDDKTINKFFKGFDQLSPLEFFELYKTSALVSRVYELYIPTRNMGDLKLSTSEDDARQLIDTLIEEKDELIQQAKDRTKMHEESLAEFTKELAKMPNKRVKAKTRLKRSELTAEQIKQIEELGWDDILE